MQRPARSLLLPLILCTTAAYSQQQSTPAQTAPSAARAAHPRSPGCDVASGAGDIGKGAAGAVGNVAKGAGKGVVDIVTLSPIDGVVDVSKGVGLGAKDAGVGAVTGTGKILKGTGRAIKHIF